MDMYDIPTRRSRRSDRPFNPGRRHRADFARAAVFTEFSPRDAKAILQADFVDRAPGDLRRPR